MRSVALYDDFVIPRRDELLEALDHLSGAWNAGPFGEPTRRLLVRHRDAIGAMLARYDRLVEAVAGAPERMVPTHGEPHRGNTLTIATGVLLIDWDTALFAPPERDLWSLALEDPSMLDEYAARTGRATDAAALELYRLAWDLAEICIYVDQFRQPHHETAHTALAWRNLAGYLDPERSRGAPDPTLRSATSKGAR